MTEVVGVISCLKLCCWLMASAHWLIQECLLISYLILIEWTPVLTGHDAGGKNEDASVAGGTDQFLSDTGTQMAQ